MGVKDSEKPVVPARYYFAKHDNQEKAVALYNLDVDRAISMSGQE
jgi:hypothetical protein